MIRTNKLYKKFLVFLLIVFFPAGIALGESNFDFFFKNNAHYQDVVVKKVLSADTIILEEKIGEKGETVKLIGLHAPDIPRKRKSDIKRDLYGFTIKEPVNPMTPLEEKAFEFVKELLEGKHVRLEFDVERQGEDFSTLAYVFLIEDNTFANEQILRQGFAHLRLRPPNMKYAEKLRDAYQEADAEQRGLQGQY